MSYDTLVLNRSWIPVHIIDWKRSVSLIYQGHANAVCHQWGQYNWEEWLGQGGVQTVGKDFKTVHTVNYEVIVPDIILLTRYNKLPYRDIKYSRENVFTRDKNRCGYCGKQFPKEKLTIDHIHPKCKDGKSEWTNVISCCPSCNAKKADRDLNEVNMRLRIQPTEPRWYSPLHKVQNQKPTRPGWEKFLKYIST